MITKLPYGLAAFPLIGGGMFDMFAGVHDNVYFVDGDKGSDGYGGQSPDEAKKTLQSAVTLAAAQNLVKKSGSVIYVKNKYMAAGATDPGSYTENVVIPAAGGAGMTIIGIGGGRVQGAIPQFKASTTTSPIITVRAPGVTLFNLGINGAGATAGGILLDDDGSTKTAFGATIFNCHFKNCVGSTATDARTGGAIQIGSGGGCWQTLIKGNRFYKNVGDVVLLGTSTVPQDIIIDDNTLSGPAANVDCNLYLAAGSGINGLEITNNRFPAFPNIGSGSVLLFMDLTGCVGSMSGNFFGANGKTYKAAGTGAYVPATMLMGRNFQEVTSSGGTSSGEFGRAS